MRGSRFHARYGHVLDVLAGNHRKSVVQPLLRSGFAARIENGYLRVARRTAGSAVHPAWKVCFCCILRGNQISTGQAGFSGKKKGREGDALTLVARSEIRLGTQAYPDDRFTASPRPISSSRRPLSLRSFAGRANVWHKRIVRRSETPARTLRTVYHHHLDEQFGVPASFRVESRRTHLASGEMGRLRDIKNR